VLDQQHRDIQGTQKIFEPLGGLQRQQRTLVSLSHLLRYPLHVAVGELVVVCVLGDLRESPDIAPEIRADHPAEGIQDVAVERRPLALGAEGDCGVTEGKRLDRVGTGGRQAGRLRDAELVAHHHAAIPVAALDLGQSPVDHRLVSSGVGRWLVPDAGRIEGGNLGPFLEQRSDRPLELGEGRDEQDARARHAPIKSPQLERKRAPGEGPFVSERTCRQENQLPWPVGPSSLLAMSRTACGPT
jgi:hypothetical protein